MGSASANVNIFDMAVLGEFSLAEYKDFNGCLLPSEFFTVKEKIEHFEVRDSDVWIASYPKSGAAWLQELLWLLYNDLNYKEMQMDAEQKFPLIEVNSLYKSLEIFRKKHNVPEDSNMENKVPDVFKVLNEVQGVRFIKTHLPWHLLPRQIKDGIRKPKILYLLKHPKKIAPLYYNHMANKLQAYRGAKTKFYQLYTDGKLLYGDFFANALSYWNKRYLPNVMIVTHEDMCSNLEPVLRDLMAFLDRTYGEEEIGQVVQHFALSDAKRTATAERSTVVRKDGNEIIVAERVGGPETELPEDLSERLDIWVAENAYGTGLPYEKTWWEN